PWMSPWGLAAASCASLAVVLATQLGVRWPSLTASGLGLAVALAGAWAARARGPARGRPSLALGGALCAATLSLGLFAPSVLNPWWGTVAPPETDPNYCEVVPRTAVQEPGRPLEADEWVDSTRDLIRQDNLLIQVVSAKKGHLPEREKATFLLVNVRI